MVLSSSHHRFSLGSPCTMSGESKHPTPWCLSRETTRQGSVSTYLKKWTTPVGDNRSHHIVQTVEKGTNIPTPPHTHVSPSQEGRDEILGSVPFRKEEEESHGCHRDPERRPDRLSSPIHLQKEGLRREISPDQILYST